jgi:2-dehydropantoate 2-reductase
VRHAVLGAGGIGGLIAASLARSGAEVTLLLRPESLTAYSGRLRVESAVLGDFEVDVPASPSLDRGIDALWVATKATQLDVALRLTPRDVVGEGVVVPLLNGVDHIVLLRQRYPRVVAAAIRVESERAGPGLIRQKSPFLRVDMAGAEALQAALREAAIDCHARSDEATLLWEKLVMLAPIALATSAFDVALGEVRETMVFVECRAEAAAAARAAGATVDLDSIRSLHTAVPPDMQSSMQKDLAAGREPELEAIAGPILRFGREHDVPTYATQSLVDRISARMSEAK